LHEINSRRATSAAQFPRAQDATRPHNRALAKALGRDYSNAHADVQALTAAGLLDATDGGLRADYDAIETKIAI
jgi:predicted transcriptional regulator